MRQQESLGDQVRRIANQLQNEKTLQIKSTSQILEAAAQISANHDRLIDEVAYLFEEDLTQQSLKKNYTVEILQDQFGTLREAKSYFGLRTNSWKNLAKKLNFLSGQGNLATEESNASISKRLSSIESEIKIMHAEISQILLLLTQAHH